MQRHELRRAVELPARHAGVAIEPGLADALVADVEQEPGALPLLSTALFALWDEGLTLDAYERTGGVRGAVARLAEAAYARLDDDGRAEARRILLRLAGDGDVRTRVPLAELGDGAVLSALARDRLVTVSEGEAEVAHEALLREWPRLRSWLEEDAEGTAAASAPHPRRARLERRPERALPRAAARGGAGVGRRPRARPQRPRAELSRRRPRRQRARAAPPAARARRRGHAPGARGHRRRRRAQPAGPRPRGGGGRRCAAPRRPGAHRGRPRPRAAARPPGRGAGRLAADPREPALRPAQEPGGDRRAARRRRRADQPRPQPRRAHAGVRRHRRHGDLRRPAHAAAGGGRRPTSAARSPASSSRRSGSTTCASAPTAHGSPSAGASRSSSTRTPIACSLGCAVHRRDSSTRCASRPTGARCSPPSGARRRATRRSSASTRAAAGRSARSSHAGDGPRDVDAHA